MVSRPRSVRHEGSRGVWRFSSPPSHRCERWRGSGGDGSVHDPFRPSLDPLVLPRKIASMYLAGVKLGFGAACFGVVVRRTGLTGSGSIASRAITCPRPASFIPGRISALPSDPEVGARCVNRARRDLCGGGHPVTGVPTAITPHVVTGYVGSC